MKWSEFFKKIGISLDDEMDETKKETSDVENNNEKNNDNNKDDEQRVNKLDTAQLIVESIKEYENYKNVEDNKEDKKVEIKFDDKTGLFDLNDIEDESIKSVLQQANDYTIKTANNVKIEKAFSEKLSGMKIRKGITNDAIKKLINFENIKVDGDNVIGMDEAFENLQKEQSGLFVTRQASESNPILEGFNPVQNNDNNVTDLSSGLAALSASLGNN